MTQSTINKLNKINQDFYFRISKYWNNNDDSAQYGWRTLVEILKEPWVDKKEISILDLGCGNARFATFIQNSFPDLKINYVGIDTDPKFLDNGKDRNKNFESYSLIKKDLVKDDWQSELKNKKFDLVVLFGILHHIPGNENRQKLLNQSSELLKPNGQLVFSGWRFLDKDRLKKRVIKNNSLYQKHLLTCHDLKKSDLEFGDYILDWVKYEYSVRYTHYISESEAIETSAISKLEIKNHFVDDSFQRDQNNYWVCERI